MATCQRGVQSDNIVKTFSVRRSRAASSAGYSSATTPDSTEPTTHSYTSQSPDKWQLLVDEIQFQKTIPRTATTSSFPSFLSLISFRFWMSRSSSSVSCALYCVVRPVSTLDGRMVRWLWTMWKREKVLILSKPHRLLLDKFIAAVSYPTWNY